MTLTSMRRFALAVGLAACGCGLPLVAPTVDVQFEDERTGGGEYDAFWDRGVDWDFTLIPLVPFQTDYDTTMRELAFEATIRSAVDRSGRFGRVTGIGSPPAERHAAVWFLRAILEDTRTSRTRTTYLLGVFAYPLYVVGLPCAYSTSTATVRVECVDRTGRIVTASRASNREVDAHWIYGSSSRVGDLARAIELAVADALAELDAVAAGRDARPAVNE